MKLLIYFLDKISYILLISTNIAVLWGFIKIPLCSKLSKNTILKTKILIIQFMACVVVMNLLVFNVYVKVLEIGSTALERSLIGTLICVLTVYFKNIVIKLINRK